MGWLSSFSFTLYIYRSPQHGVMTERIFSQSTCSSHLGLTLELSFMFVEVYTLCVLLCEPNQDRYLAIFFLSTSSLLSQLLLISFFPS